MGHPHSSTMSTHPRFLFLFLAPLQATCDMGQLSVAPNLDPDLRVSAGLVSGMMRSRDRLDSKMREPPAVEVPYTAGKPRNYKRKPATNSCRPPYTHTHSNATQQTRAHHHHHSNHLPLPLLRHFVPLPVPVHSPTPKIVQLCLGQKVCR
ncbi:uncharacterized protein HD556DRAFT_268922 [Suillus plorans]|uniref:Uncharacterized protein n=1 Tax=Suillus plorans TaxID=116603 RepID=A0A9P7DKH6_9AGAM|nr:uncharacterized protein HD556DRAFT_268922 [Suillus plorans]KAG1797029.1 hypothetical protein HD556DRAFT_268922 [Suillus plorans]